MFVNEADALNELSDIIKKLTEATGYSININGFVALNPGEKISEFGKELSLARANTVKELLVSKGIDRSRITTKGQTESDTVGIENRKVEIEYIRKIN